MITPYKAQVEKIKEVFRENFNYLFRAGKRSSSEFIENGSTPSIPFKDGEKRSSLSDGTEQLRAGQPRKTGFLKDFRRVNVSLSRARKKMILIGDYDTLTNSDNLVVRYIFRQIKNLRAEQKIIL